MLYTLYSTSWDNKPRLRPVRVRPGETFGLSEAKFPPQRGTNIRRALSGRVEQINQSVSQRETKTERERRTFIITGLFTFLRNPRSRFLCTRLGLQVLIDLITEILPENVGQDDSQQRIQDQPGLAHVAFQVRTNLLQGSPVQ